MQSTTLGFGIGNEAELRIHVTVASCLFLPLSASIAKLFNIPVNEKRIASESLEGAMSLVSLHFLFP